MKPEELTMDSIELRAYAKINLALDVIGRRKNGYHDVRMIMQTIQLFDKLTIRPIVKDELILTTNQGFLPTGKGNLVYDAARLFLDTLGSSQGFCLDLEKHIPVAAGMAGGSADAAATLVGLNEYFNHPFSDTKLAEMGLSLGADIPFCLMGGTALSEGIGEILTPLPAPPGCKLLIVKPGVNVSTRFVYENLHLGPDTKHPDIDGMLHALRTGSYTEMVSNLGNLLESVTIAHYPEIASIKEQMLALGADGALMSGSGPTVFGLFHDAHKASEAYYAFKTGSYGAQTFLSEFANHG